MTVGLSTFTANEDVGTLQLLHMTFTTQGLGHNFIVVQPSKPSVLHQLRSLSYKYFEKPMLQVSFQPFYLYAKRSLIQKLGNQQNPVQSNALHHPQRERERERENWNQMHKRSFNI